jgi:hypothetical protein
MNEVVRQPMSVLVQQTGCPQKIMRFALAWRPDTPNTALLETGPHPRTGEPVTWHFARRVLVDGLLRPAGRGGATAKLSVTDPGWLVLNLTTDTSTLLPVMLVQRFLDRTFEVQAARLTADVDLDAAYESLCDGAR